ncbi:hypothetical protein NPIL_318081 [Nephila pilipes]|uniref:Uncharacterized protein n=1 Tax=Nephila pilipes TaxID=299642 RepID=A0A8X6JSE3_NEPPI|nr:hypothetical protein NPIL_318081 [Nephila pilipes]
MHTNSPVGLKQEHVLRDLPSLFHPHYTPRRIELRHFFRRSFLCVSMVGRLLVSPYNENESFLDLIQKEYMVTGGKWRDSWSSLRGIQKSPAFGRKCDFKGGEK